MELLNEHSVTRAFEAELCRYTGAPYAIAVDNNANGMDAALCYERIKGRYVTIPSHTYMSVPCMIIRAGGKVRFRHSSPMLKGSYPLEGTNVVDAALSFTHNMYQSGKIMILSFTGPYKRLSLGKGGAILTDDPKAEKWLRKFCFNGRNQVSYHEDTFDMIGMNYYMNPMIATLGLQMMRKFWRNGKPLEFEDIELHYPDLSKHEIYSS